MSEKKLGYLIAGGVGLSVLMLVGVCSFMAEPYTPNSQSVQSMPTATSKPRVTAVPPQPKVDQREANEIAMTLRTNYPLWTCAVMLDRFGRVVERHEAAGHSLASAQGKAVRIKAGEKGLSDGVYRARLVRCSDLWRDASQSEKIEAMRKAGL